MSSTIDGSQHKSPAGRRGTDFGYDLREVHHIPHPRGLHNSLVVAAAAKETDKALRKLPMRKDVSRSQELIDGKIQALQNAIDDRPLGTSFELKDLFGYAEWQTDVVGQKLDKSITRAFKNRIRGWQGAQDPMLINVQVGDVRQNGRERMFIRIAGDHRAV
ncbi:MAG: hypothetical protein DI616_19250 [Paracoccus denitrificans]|uniref:Uncharacterized protein n=1 Tax=Paracoccus denitrificans TaxID=266 RepID=A0A533I1M7_PARDE|nr:MAG: hypothetical protein DI616_19250 [Paracoccus denitrificans]